MCAGVLLLYTILYCTALHCTALYCTNIVTVQGFVFCALLEFALVNYASR